MYDHEGLPVPENEPGDKKILVWEVDPAIGNCSYDTWCFRNYYEMLDYVADNLDDWVSDHTTEACRKGLTLKLRLIPMTVEEWHDCLEWED